MHWHSDIPSSRTWASIMGWLKLFSSYVDQTSGLLSPTGTFFAVTPGGVQRWPSTLN